MSAGPPLPVDLWDRYPFTGRDPLLLLNLLQGLSSRVAHVFVLVLLPCLGERRNRRLGRRADLPQGPGEISPAVCVPCTLECRDEGRDRVFLGILVSLPEKLCCRPHVPRVAALQTGEGGLRLRADCPEEHDDLGTDPLVGSTFTEDLSKNWCRRLLRLPVTDPPQGAGAKVPRLQVLVVERFGEGRHGGLGFRPKRSQGTGGIAADVTVLVLECPGQGRDRHPRLGADPPQGFCRAPTDLA